MAFTISPPEAMITSVTQELSDRWCTVASQAGYIVISGVDPTLLDSLPLTPPGMLASELAIARTDAELDHYGYSQKAIAISNKLRAKGPHTPVDILVQGQATASIRTEEPVIPYCFTRRYSTGRPRITPEGDHHMLFSIPENRTLFAKDMRLRPIILRAMFNILYPVLAEHTRPPQIPSVGITFYDHDEPAPHSTYLPYMPSYVHIQY